MIQEKIFNPFHQFEIYKIVEFKLAGFNIIITNSAFASLFCFVLTGVLFIMASFKSTPFKPNKIMVCFESLYKAIHTMVSQSIGEYGNSFYQKLIFTLFIFILSTNLIGLMPMGFTFTSHIIITFALALIVFIVCIGISLVRHRHGFLKIFLPEGTPMLMVPLIFALEIFSYLARPISLSVRLAANMVAGHVMLDVIAYFVILTGFFGLFPFAFLVVLQIFEIFVALLQAYIFSMLACVYIGESVHH